MCPFMLQPMTASFSRPDEPEAARAERKMWMQTMCPMHQTMVSATAMVGSRVVLRGAALLDICVRQPNAQQANASTPCPD